MLMAYPPEAPQITSWGVDRPLPEGGLADLFELARHPLRREAFQHGSATMSCEFLRAGLIEQEGLEPLGQGFGVIGIAEDAAAFSFLSPVSTAGGSGLLGGLWARLRAAA